MDEQTAAAARANSGIVPAASLGTHVSRSARARGLVAVQPRVLIAQTQPVGPLELVAAVRTSREEGVAFLGWTALWLYGLAAPPDRVSVGVRHSTRYRAEPTVQVRRLSPQVLEGTRTVNGACVVALEVAVVQACEKQQRAIVLELVERVLRDRRSTMGRLRGRCRRGVGGSAAVRRAIDELAGTSLDAAVRRLRAALTVRGVSGLRIEARFVSAQGASAYVDLLDEQSQTAVEVDGYLTHTERDRFRADRRRDRWMHMEHGILTVRVDVAETLAGAPLEAVADELAALILDRRARLLRPA